MALDRARAPGTDSMSAIGGAGANGSKGCRARTGGWGAFDADNVYHYLNKHPFADHGALLDPPTEDVTGRCVGHAGRNLANPPTAGMRAAISYLERTQLSDGSWFGRWGVNYIYVHLVGSCRPSVRRASIRRRR